MECGKISATAKTGMDFRIHFIYPNYCFTTQVCIQLNKLLLWDLSEPNILCLEETMLGKWMISSRQAHKMW